MNYAIVKSYATIENEIAIHITLNLYTVFTKISQIKSQPLNNKSRLVIRISDNNWNEKAILQDS